jgi:carbonic anhydrase
MGVDHQPKFLGAKMKKRLVAVCLTAFASLSYAEGAVKWGYDGNIGPANWGDLSKEFAVCKTGQVQAPIDIQTKQASKNNAPIKINYKASSGEILNNGHTIQVSLADGGSANLGGTDYKILQFHMHTPAEEKIDGKSFPFNAHMVHKSADGKLAVIGVLFNEGKENIALKEVFANLPATEGKTPLKASFNASSMLPSSLAYYNYAGSLTTPGCSEGVQFFILKTPVELSGAQLSAFKKIFPMNARPVMPLNGRKITEGG